MATKNPNVIEVPLDVLAEAVVVLGKLMKAASEARGAAVTCDAHATLVQLIKNHSQ